MILITHIIIALSSVAMATYLFLNPSKTTLHLSYSLVALTIITGAYLTFIQPAHLMHTCVAGLIYFAFILVLLVKAQYRLSQARACNQTDRK